MPERIGRRRLESGFCCGVAVSWSLRFAEPIVLPDGRKLATLRDAVRHLAKIIPEAERDMLEVLTASDLLTQAAEHNGPRPTRSHKS